MRASSAILNTLLKILNERTFDAGDGVVRKVPLKLCVAASNEWASPDTGKELAAMLDHRPVLAARKAVQPIRSRVGRERLLWTADHTPRLSGTISPAEVEDARKSCRSMLPWSGEAKEAARSRPRRSATGSARRRPAGRPPAVQDGRHRPRVRIPRRRRRGPARAPGGGAAHALGRSPRAAPEGGAGDRADRQPRGHARHPTAPRSGVGAGRDRRAQPGRGREARPRNWARSTASSRRSPATAGWRRPGCT